MDYNIGIMYLGIICIAFIILRIFIKPIKLLAKVLVKTVIGGGFLYLVNLLGITHIGINILTLLTIGVFGIPGAILLLATQIA